jgi:DNA-binding SARP family transcriptional activator/tetratricopeptide (TPR) repeat protein
MPFTHPLWSVDNRRVTRGLAPGQGHVEFRVLGPVELTVDGTTVAVGHPRQRCVLAVLLVDANRGLAAEEIIDRVWGEDPPVRVRNVLSGYVTRLRSAITAVTSEVELGRSGAGYRLRVAAAQVDMHHFTDLLGRARGTEDPRAAFALLQEALALWRGEPFAGLPSPWLRGTARRLAEAHLSAELSRGELAVRLGEPASVPEHLLELVQQHPLDERVATQLISTLESDGRRAEALEAFQQFRTRLADELGIDPSERLRALHLRILRAGDSPAREAKERPSPVPPAPPRPVARQLPAALPGFVGRAAPLRALDSWRPGTTPPTAVTAVINGTAGVGKTALAIAWAHLRAGDFPDGQLYLNLRGFNPQYPSLAPSDALGRLLRALGTPDNRIPLEVDEQSAALRTALARQRVLLVLDNAVSSGQVRPLLPGDPACMTIVTSRNRLSGLTAEGARLLTLDALIPAEAASLITDVVGERARRAPAQVAVLARHCACLPLAVRIAADRIAARPGTSLAAAVREMANERERLDLLSTDEESTSVRVAFSLSYQALKPDVARVFRLLGCQAGPTIGVPAAAALTGHAVPRARRLLEALADGHLLERAGADRYQFHDLLRVYATERVHADEPPAEIAHATGRLMRWYLSAAAVASRLIAPAHAAGWMDQIPAPELNPSIVDYETALRWADSERTNLLAMQRQAATAGEHALAWQFGAALWRYFEVRRPWPEWRTAEELALEAARHLGDRAAQATVLQSLGNVHYYPRRFAEAMDCYREALAIRREVGDRSGEANVLNNIGNVYLETSRFDEAERYFTDAVALHTTIGDTSAAGISQSNLAEMYNRLGRHADALRHARAALPALRAGGNRRIVVFALCHLGNAELGLGRGEDGLEHLADALALSRAISDRQTEAWTLGYLGEAMASLGRPAPARDYWVQAIAVFDDIADPQAGDLRARLAADPPSMIPQSGSNGAAAR